MAEHIAFDLDGVLHSYTSGWINDTTVANAPVAGAIERLIEFHFRFKEICIFTARAKTPEAVEAIRKWLIKWGVPRYIANTIEISNIKHGYDYLIDDKANFSGVWPSIEYLKEFVPWWQKT